jgi:hypothetical protein
MGCKLIEPDIVRELRKEEKQRLLKKHKIHSNNPNKNQIEKLEEIEFIFNLQNIIIEEFLSKIKEGKIKTNHQIVISLYELLNYYKSDYWKIISDKISIDKHILSFYHLINTYIEHLEYSSKNKESDLDKDRYNDKIMKLKNLTLTLNSINR